MMEVVVSPEKFVQHKLQTLTKGDVSGSVVQFNHLLNPVFLTDPSSCMFLFQLPVQCCAVVMASTRVVAASATAGGKALSVMCQTTSALISTVEDTAFALWVPVSATLVIKEIIVKKVRIISYKKREEKVHYLQIQLAVVGSFAVILLNFFQFG